MNLGFLTLATEIYQKIKNGVFVTAKGGAAIMFVIGFWFIWDIRQTNKDILANQEKMFGIQKEQASEIGSMLTFKEDDLRFQESTKGSIQDLSISMGIVKDRLRIRSRY